MRGGRGRERRMREGEEDESQKVKGRGRTEGIIQEEEKQIQFRGNVTFWGALCVGRSQSRVHDPSEALLEGETDKGINLVVWLNY